MHLGQSIEADYAVIGSGAVGMAFVDTLLAESTASVVMIDRHHGPGGHWNDAYPFVRLHQPSAYYGVSSKKLGRGAKDATGLNVGMYERATGAELVSYYEQLMQEFLATGRVKYFPMCDYLGEADGVHPFKSLMSGETRQLNIQNKLVDCTYLQTAVPSTHPPKYEVAEGVTCVPLNDLPRVKAPPSGYVVVGSGKTGIDACLWLLENGTSPDRITWVMPRDAWYMNRAFVQPGEEFFLQSYGSFTAQMKAVAEATSFADLLKRLSASKQLLRLDDGVKPTMYHGAIMSESELRELQRIKNVVRMGRVTRIEQNQIIFQYGVLATDPDRLYVDCSASAVARRPVVPIFAGNRITPQFVRTVQPTFSAAFVAHVEANYARESEKNALCGVVPLPDEPIHWLIMLAANMRNQARWGKDKGLRNWIANNRLDGFTALAKGVKPDDGEKMALLQGYGQHAAAAAANIQKLIETGL